jgi:signal transduction histidine kinase
MRRFSLRFKLWLALTALTIVVSALLGAIAIYRLNYELDEQFVKLGESLARHISQEAIQALERDHREDVPRMLAGILTQDLVYVQIVYGSNVLGEERSVDFLVPVEPTPSRTLQRKTRLSDGRPLLDLMLPFAVNNANAEGYVRLGLVLTYLTEEIQLEARIIGMAVLGAILLGTLLTTWLYRKLVRPLGTLSDSVRAFGSGSLATRAHVQTRDELQDLAEDFNKMADSIVRMQEELKQANKAKSEFLTVMGHELRTPLNALIGYTELLLEEVDGKLNKTQKERLRSAQRSGQHMSELLENMLRFSKLEMGAEKLHLQEIDCRQLIEDTLQAIMAVAQEKKLEIRSTRRTRLPWVADPMKLRQILLNLLDNAVKYSERGSIEIGVRHAKDEVIFMVSDHGQGIAEQDLKKIFEPFTQLGRAVTRESRGMGLGLAIVKRYVEMHGGRVWVESTLGQGSTFSFTIPKRVRASISESL